MAGFKIVQTTEKGSQKLFIVPSAWEYKGLLRYPKKPCEYKLAKNENSEPNAAWLVMPCKVKRFGFPTYEDADEELSLMLRQSDTDVDNPEKNYSTAAVDETNFNDMASQLILQTQVDAPQPSAMTTNEQISGETYLIFNESNEIYGNSYQNQPDNNIVIQKLDTILANQKNMMEIQKRFAQRIGNLVIEIEAKVEKVMKRVLDSQTVTVTSLASARTIENTAFTLKPIDNIDELEEFELLLLDPVEKSKLMQVYSILCARSDGHGITCAYKLIDILFTREFLCQCSWSGGSRGDKIKIALKGYKNVLDFFFRMVLFWDKTFTTDANENFFKVVLRNSEQRKNIKNLRRPTQRKRTRKLENQPQKIKKMKRVDPAETNAEKEEDEVENVEEEGMKDSEEEVENNIEDGVEKDSEEESDENLEEEMEKDKENEMNKDLHEESEKKLEEDIEKDKENEMEIDLEEEVEEIDNNLEKVMEKGKKENIENETFSKIKIVLQNKESENRERSCNKFKNFRAVKNLKAQDNGDRRQQTAPKTNQRNMGDRPGSSNILENLKTAPKKIKTLDNKKQSVTPPKKLKKIIT